MKSFEQTFSGIKFPVLWSAPPHELKILFDLTRNSKPENIIEIGTGPGSALLAMHEGYPAARIITVDVCDKMIYNNALDIGFIFRNSRPTNPSQLTFFRGESHAFVAQYKSDVLFDFLYIDAEHCHPAPLMDLANLLPLMKPNFTLAMQICDPKYYGDETSIGATRLYNAITKSTYVTQQGRECNFGWFYVETAKNNFFLRQVLLNYDWADLPDFAYEWRKPWTPTFNPYADYIR